MVTDTQHCHHAAMTGDTEPAAHTCAWCMPPCDSSCSPAAPDAAACPSPTAATTPASPAGRHSCIERLHNCLHCWVCTLPRRCRLFELVSKATGSGRVSERCRWFTLLHTCACRESSLLQDASARLSKAAAMSRACSQCARHLCRCVRLKCWCARCLAARLTRLLAVYARRLPNTRRCVPLCSAMTASRTCRRRACLRGAQLRQRLSTFTQGSKAQHSTARHTQDWG